jgi:uncharacterized DUF497 family protein
MYDFRWNDWNREHIGEHDVEPFEAELVVNHARRPWPEKIGDKKWRVWGVTAVGRYLQVIYVFDPDDVIYVLHARELGDAEKRNYRRRKR